ncbi:hypothetical protein [Dictyobacter formicarum]|uniref:Exosortase/archaeosortase family protein n=1 Tax=Dictyobacter formicarum TaxID=2778368 RepID=A0ABQ3VJB3_9CHLR|nr:hypothetical protein [Dictyobacter formicarum]GHO85216.1 hypothetical protein KSZ_32220 [Dictyobacter formicarum]
MNKKQIRYLFTGLALFLAFFPFLTTFNEIGTRIAENSPLYHFLQEWVVPFEVKMVANILRLFAIKLSVYGNSTIAINHNLAKISWNCIGWQSMLLVVISLIMGLQGNFTIASKIETILLALIGTYFINIFRMVFILWLLATANPLYALIYHNLLAIIVTLLWLFLFWWFSYGFVLEVKQSNKPHQ